MAQRPPSHTDSGVGGGLSPRPGSGPQDAPPVPAGTVRGPHPASRAFIADGAVRAPRAETTVWATSAGAASGANSTSQAPSANSCRIWVAA
jgi:hypothetical protein